MHVYSNLWVWTTASFLFGGVFAGDIRRLILATFTGGRHSVLKFRLSNVRAKLALLNQLHGSAYELLRYLGEQSVWLGLTVFLFLGQTYMSSVPEAASLFHQHTYSAHQAGAQRMGVSGTQNPGDDWIAKMVVAGLYCYLALSIGRLIALFGLLRSLRDFPAIKARLHRQMQKVDSRLQRARALERPVKAGVAIVDGPSA